jgi:hypothetical protein
VHTPPGVYLRPNRCLPPPNKPPNLRKLFARYTPEPAWGLSGMKSQLEPTR